jgi:hypothetical protein
MDGDLDLPASIAGARFAAGSVALVLAFAFGASRRRGLAVGPVVSRLDRMAETCLSFERWVIDATGAAAATAVVAAAWVADSLDARVLGAPADTAARGVVRVAYAVRPLAGGSLLRVFWLLVAACAVACVGHGLWPSR